MGFRRHRSQSVSCAACSAPRWRTPTDQGPVLVIPGRPGIPVVINGYDASYTIVEGDWGLARPGQVSPVIVSGPLITPAPYYTGHYYPVSRDAVPAMAAAKSSRRRIGAAAPGAELLPRVGRRVAATAGRRSIRRHYPPTPMVDRGADDRVAIAPTVAAAARHVDRSIIIARRTMMIRRSLSIAALRRVLSAAAAVSSASAGSPCCCAAPCAAYAGRAAGGRLRALRDAADLYRRSGPGLFRPRHLHQSARW